MARYGREAARRSQSRARLNQQYFESFHATRIVKKEGTLPEAMAPEPDKLAIVEKLRKDEEWFGFAEPD